MQHKKASELRTGDVVWTHGMRCVIDGEMHSRTIPYEDGPVTVYWTNARVTNIDDVPNDRVPHNWLYEDKWVKGVGWTLDKSKPPRWVIQGNDLGGTWTVEFQQAEAV